MKKNKNKNLIIPSIRRLPSYLHLLKELKQQNVELISTTAMSEKLKLDAISIRKDLALTEIKGRPKVGYNVTELITAIENFLGWSNRSDAFVVGMGHLGQALVGYSGFENYGLRIVCGFDTDEALVGRKIKGINIFDISELPILIKRLHVEMLILTVPKDQAQEVAEIAVKAGVRGIWNFTPTKLDLPDSVIIQKEDMAAGLAVLSARLFHE